MKIVKVAFVLLFASLFAVVANSVILGNIVNDITAKVEAVTDEDAALALAKYEEIYGNYRKKTAYISLSVSHDDLTRIDEGFTELIGAARVGDLDTVASVKSRLIGSLEHLRRLSGINMESIF